DLFVNPRPRSQIVYRHRPAEKSFADAPVPKSLALRALRPPDQHIRHFRSAELHGGTFAGAEHVAHLRPAQMHLRLRAVRTSLGADHSLAHLAPRTVLELERRNADLARDVELVEDSLGVIRGVVVA